jgi:hypothetical protein
MFVASERKLHISFKVLKNQSTHVSCHLKLNLLLRLIDQRTSSRSNDDVCMCIYVGNLYRLNNLSIQSYSYFDILHMYIRIPVFFYELAPRAELFPLEANLDPLGWMFSPPFTLGGEQTLLYLLYIHRYCKLAIITRLYIIGNYGITMHELIPCQSFESSRSAWVFFNCKDLISIKTPFLKNPSRNKFMSFSVIKMSLETAIKMIASWADPVIQRQIIFSEVILFRNEENVLILWSEAQP